MMLIRVALFPLLLLAVTASAAVPGTPRVANPRATAIVAEWPAECPALRAATVGAVDAGASVPAGLPPAARELARTGAQVTVVCNAADALVAVVRAASTHQVVLGFGPDVRPALAQAAADHPDICVATLPGESRT